MMSEAVEVPVMLSSSSPNSKIVFAASGPGAFPDTDVLDPKAETSSQAAPALHLRGTNGISIASSNDELQGKAREDELERSNKFVEDKQIKPFSAIKRQYGNVIVIQPLPESITKRDILCRVRGGKVMSCILSRFRGKPIAIVKFQDPSSANHYVDFCAEDFTKEIWTFPAGKDFIPCSEVTMTSHVRIYNEAPGLGSTWHAADIPANFYDYPSAATRCLVLRNCPVERVPQVWARLGLQKSEHLQKQLEDMWLDQPKVDHAGGKATGTLHVWFSDINTAVLVKQRYYGPLEYEADPCSAMPEDTFILRIPEPCTQLGSQQPTTQHGLEGDSGYAFDEGSEDRYAQSSELAPEDVYIHYHSFPFVSLLDLQRMSIMDGLSQGLLDPMKLLLHSSAPSMQDKVENMGLADRLTDALQRHRFGQTVDRRGMRRAGVQPPNNATVSAPVLTGTYPHGATQPILQQTAADRSRGNYMASLAPMVSCPPNTHYTRSFGYDGGKDEELPQASAIPCEGPSHPDTPEPQAAGPRCDQSLQSQPLLESHSPSNAEYLVQAPYPTATKPRAPPCVAARPVPVGAEPGYTLQFLPPPNGDRYGLAEYYASKGRDNIKSWESFNVEPRDDEYTPCGECEPLPDTTEPIVSNDTGHEVNTRYQSGRLAGSSSSFQGDDDYHQPNLMDAQGDADIRVKVDKLTTPTNTSSSVSLAVSAPFSGSNLGKDTPQCPDATQLHSAHVSCSSADADHNTNDKATQAGNTAEPIDTAGTRARSQLDQTADGTVNVSPMPQTAPDYSHQNWDGGRRPEDVFWTVSLDEFKAMNDDQWKAFGTSFYSPPAGFNTAKRHVVELE